MIHFFHHWQPWRIVTSIPLWSNGYSSSICAGNQPQTYMNCSDYTSRPFPDHNYHLIGKLVEQERKCKSCGLSQFKWNKVLVP